MIYFKEIKRMLFLIAFFFPCVLFSQSIPPPASGVNIIIDSVYQVGSSDVGVSKAKLTVNNLTDFLVTGYQFRVFYDNSAFSSAEIKILGSSSNLILDFIDNNSSGYITVTIVYTGIDVFYEIPDGERFELSLTHVESSSFYNILKISDLSWVGIDSFPEIASTQDGLDAELNLYSYGGVWQKPTLDFDGIFTNVTGTPAKNLTIALEKKTKSDSNWSRHSVYTTNNEGSFNISEEIDTTYYDVRLSINGDTISVGNTISSADAQLINQWVLGALIPTGFDFYTGDINNSNGLTVSDVYGVFGRIAGRFTEWPNSVKDVRFFTSEEYNTIVENPSFNYTGTIPGKTSFYYEIKPGQKNVQFYVLVNGDANGTGYHMARITPIKIEVEPLPDTPAAAENVIDMSVEYDFSTDSIEVSLPHLSVNEGNLVELPVIVNTNGNLVSSIQLALVYNSALLDFKDIKNSENVMNWMSSINPTDGIIEWVGYDPSLDRRYMIVDGDEVFKLRFAAKKPQNQWNQSPLYTIRKFAGDEYSKDLSISPNNGILVVYQMTAPGGTIILEETKILVYPNPTSGFSSINFEVKNNGRVHLSVHDMSGDRVITILEKDMPAGVYTYNFNLESFKDGLYFATLQSNTQTGSTKIIKK
jgi:hypothetical protein